MILFCIGCDKEVNARLTDGAEIYPNRNDLRSLSFYKCDTCKNYVGCHKQRKKDLLPIPLGFIPTKELMTARKHIHALLDPLWKSGRIKRSDLYSKISMELGYEYHTAEIKNLDEGRKIYAIGMKIKNEMRKV